MTMSNFFLYQTHFLKHFLIPFFIFYCIMKLNINEPSCANFQIFITFQKNICTYGKKFWFEWTFWEVNFHLASLYSIKMFVWSIIVN
jgi:hypothetical protein